MHGMRKFVRNSKCVEIKFRPKSDVHDKLDEQLSEMQRLEKLAERLRRQIEAQAGQAASKWATSLFA